MHLLRIFLQKMQGGGGKNEARLHSFHLTDAYIISSKH